MRVVQLGLNLETDRLVLQRQQGSTIEHIEVSNCLVRQVVGEQVLDCDVPMSTLELQLLQDIRSLCMSIAAADFAEDAAMLEAKFGSNCNILELARVGPRTLTIYREDYEDMQMNFGLDDSWESEQDSD
jgi:hypothetical protein